MLYALSCSFCSTPHDLYSSMRLSDILRTAFYLLQSEECVEIYVFRRSERIKILASGTSEPKALNVFVLRMNGNSLKMPPLSKRQVTDLQRWHIFTLPWFISSKSNKNQKFRQSTRSHRHFIQQTLLTSLVSESNKPRSMKSRTSLKQSKITKNSASIRHLMVNEDVTTGKIDEHRAPNERFDLVAQT